MFYFNSEILYKISSLWMEVTFGIFWFQIKEIPILIFLIKARWWMVCEPRKSIEHCSILILELYGSIEDNNKCVKTFCTKTIHSWIKLGTSDLVKNSKLQTKWLVGWGYDKLASKVLREGKLISVALHTNWNQFSLGCVCKQE